MKANAIIRIVIYSVLVVILLGIMGGFVAEELYLSEGMLHRVDSPLPTEAARKLEQQQVTTQVQNIEIAWVAGSIAIHPSDSLDSIQIDEFSESGSAYEMVCRQSGQTLKIEFSEESFKFPSFGVDSNVSKDLIIRVPKNWNCNSLEIDAAATDVTIQDLTIRELDFDGASGTLVLDNCNVTELDVDTASGYVEFIGTLEELDLDAASAEFYGEFYNTPRKLNMDSMSGDLELVLPEESGFTLKFDSMDESFKTDFMIGKADDAYVCGNGECKINVSAMSGNVSILKGIN